MSARALRPSATHQHHRPPPAALCAGANHGWFTNLGAAAGLAVAAFEPVPEHCEKVRQSLAMNGLGEDVAILNENIVSTREETLCGPTSHAAPRPYPRTAGGCASAMQALCLCVRVRTCVHATVI